MKLCWRLGETFVNPIIIFKCLFSLNRKDTRNATAGINIEIIPAVPPIMEIECADPMLCLVGEGGKLFINPSSRQLSQALNHFLTFPPQVSREGPLLS